MSAEIRAENISLYNIDVTYIERPKEAQRKIALSGSLTVDKMHNGFNPRPTNVVNSPG